MDRRGFLRGVGAAAGLVIIGFDPVSRLWIQAAEALPPTAQAVPPLDGELVTDSASLTTDSTDSGNLVARRPWAVLRPRSANDVAAMIGFCHTHHISVAARGQAHSVFGQPLVDNGLVVEMATLNAVHHIDPTSATVGAGMLWSDLLDRALSIDRTPPVFTGFIGLSIGGTLSVGGIPTLNREGAQVDRVRALEVVTGAGDIVECSETTNTDLFGAVLAGVGQFGVITRATIDLVPAPDRVTHWSLSYLDPHAFFHDLRLVLDRAELPRAWGQIGPPGSPTTADPAPIRTIADTGLFSIIKPLLGPVFRLVLTPAGPAIGTVTSLAPKGLWLYQLNVAAHHRNGDKPDEAHLLRGLSDIKALRQSSDPSYRDFVLAVDALVDVLKTFGLWTGVQHPWLDNFLPGNRAEAFVINTLNGLNFGDLGAAGLILLFPQQRTKLTRPSFMMPDEDPDWVMLFDVLTSAPGPGLDAGFAARMLARNRRIYEQARGLGGKLYPISAVPTTQVDWAQHYGPRYAALQTLKATFDPDGIMTPGVPIFHS